MGATFDQASQLMDEVKTVIRDCELHMDYIGVMEDTHMVIKLFGLDVANTDRSLKDMMILVDIVSLRRWLGVKRFWDTDGQPYLLLRALGAGE